MRTSADDNARDHLDLSVMPATPATMTRRSDAFAMTRHTGAVPTFAESLPALVGVALGAAGAMTSSLLTDRLRWRREHAARWDQHRLDAYTTLPPH
jgi:hypothetical protein